MTFQYTGVDSSFSQKDCASKLTNFLIKLAMQFKGKMTKVPFTNKHKNIPLPYFHTYVCNTLQTYLNLINAARNKICSLDFITVTLHIIIWKMKFLKDRMGSFSLIGEEWRGGTVLPFLGSRVCVTWVFLSSSLTSPQNNSESREREWKMTAYFLRSNFTADLLHSFGHAGHWSIYHWEQSCGLRNSCFSKHISRNTFCLPKECLAFP